MLHIKIKIRNIFFVIRKIDIFINEKELKIIKFKKKKKKKEREEY